MKNLTEEMKNYIQYGTDEDRRWEFKPPMKWNNTGYRGEILKTIFALSNTPEGGFIIFGIFQERDRSDGNEFKKKGLSAAEFNSFNSVDDIGRYLQGKTNQEIKFNVHGNNVNIDGGNKKFIVFQIFESQLSIPIICTRNVGIQSSNAGVKSGTLYVRSSSVPVESRAIKLNEEWEELILRLLSRKEEIINNDLRALLSNLKVSKALQPVKKAKVRKKSSEYDRYLKRDKL